MSELRQTLGGLVNTLPFWGILGGKTPQFWKPEIRNPIIKKVANNSKKVRDTTTVYIEYYYKTLAGLSESTIILVAVSTWAGETLHH